MAGMVPGKRWAAQQPLPVHQSFIPQTAVKRLPGARCCAGWQGATELDADVLESSWSETAKLRGLTPGFGTKLPGLESQVCHLQTV